MFLRKFQKSDIDQIITLFYDTVHTVNKQDYTQEQLDAWASRAEERQKRELWLTSFSSSICYVVEIGGLIAGFSDLNQQGYLDRLFVHKDYQGRGIASALVSQLEAEARNLFISEMETDASITAKPFFERKGFVVVRSQLVERNGVQLMNYRMRKRL